MIIQSLFDYYNIIKDNPDFNIPLSGFSIAKANFVATLSKNGELLDIIELGEGKKRFIEVKVPEQKKRARVITPYFLCDNFKYVFGWDFDPKKNRPTQKNFNAFKDLNLSILEKVNTPKSLAMCRYLNNWNCANTINHPVIKKQLEPMQKIKSGTVIFRLDGETGYMHEEKEIKKAWLDYLDNNSKEEQRQQCLISGENSIIARIHPNIKGIRDANSTGAALVGFNADSFTSYNKKQGDNAPISKEISFGYTTVLNYMLNTNSDEQKIQIGDATTVFWAEDEAATGECEKIFKSYFEPNIKETEESKKKKHDNSGTNFVKDSLEQLKAGKEIEEKKDVKFCILGLSPNNARLSVRYWQKDTFGKTVKNIRKHYQDCDIIKYESETAIPSIRRLLYETIPENSQVKKSAPALTNGIMASVFHGQNYPYSLYSTILQRIRTDGKIKPIRCGLIKGYLLRNARANQNVEREELITMALNEENPNVPYRLGRLFAVLEKVQTDTNERINSTIKDRYFGTASTSPRFVFPVLIKLTQHHLSKFERQSWKIYVENKIQHILDNVPEFPAYLNSEDQGMFILGYYHQRMDLYKKNEDKEQLTEKRVNSKLFTEGEE